MDSLVGGVNGVVKSGLSLRKLPVSVEEEDDPGLTGELLLLELMFLF